MLFLIASMCVFAVTVKVAQTNQLIPHLVLNPEIPSTLL